MYTALQRLLAWVLIACLPLVFTGCGGGGGGGGGGAIAPTTTVSGIATAGKPIKSALVTVYTLLPDGGKGAILGTGITGDGTNDVTGDGVIDPAGTYSVKIPVTTGPILVEVSGQPGSTYTRGSTQVPFTAAESLRAVVDSLTGASITVSPLTEAAYSKVQQVLTLDPALATSGSIAGVIIAANTRIAALYGVTNILADPAQDVRYQAALLIIDQMIVNGGSGANTTTVMGIINPALVNTNNSSSPAYQQYLQAFIAAANQVVATSTDQAIRTAATEIATMAANPPPEADWTDRTPPAAPSNLTASVFAPNATTATAVLMWNPAADNKAAGYEIYRDDIKLATVTTPGYTDSTLKPTVTYRYFVVAFNAVGIRSASSNILSVTPNQATLGVTVNGQVTGTTGIPLGDITSPTPPTNLSASTTAKTGTTSDVLLAWSPATDNVGVKGYEVYRNGSKIATVTLLGYTDPGVTSNVTYTYFVIAFDAAGNRSLTSSQLAVTPNQATLGVTVNGQVLGGAGSTGLPADIIAPSAPTNLSASTTAKTATTSDVLLAWAPSTDNVAVTGYEVYRNGVKVATVTLLGYTDLGVTSSVTYNYYVIAFDAAGNRSPASSALAVTPNQASLGVTVDGQVIGGAGSSQTDITAPSAPTNLSASTAAITATTSDVILSWSQATDNVGVTGYEIFRNGSKIATVSLPGYTDAAVAPNVTYVYTVKAFDAAGNSSLSSNQISVTPPPLILNVTVSGTTPL